MFKVISGTLLANRNTIEFTDETISNNSIFEVYADQPDVIPVSVTVGGTTASITFDAKASVNTGIKVLVNNIEGEFAPDVEHIDANNVYYYNQLTGEHPIGDHFADLEMNYNEITIPLLNNIDDELHSDTVLGGVLYHATTGNTWKKLDASNIDYDSGSTIYSAMGDIDELTTTATNIVGAINELNSGVSGGLIIDTTPHIIGKFKNKDLWCVLIEGNITGGAQTITHNISNIDEIIDYNIGRMSPDGAMYVEGYGEGTSANYNFTSLYCNRSVFAFHCNGWNTGKYRAVIMYTITE